MFGAQEKRLELLIGNGVTNNHKAGGPPVAIDHGEQRLAPVVLMQESGRDHTAS